MSLILSVLALLATFYQLYLQRVHNEKSLKPLGQIDLPDLNKQLAIHIRNNGLGPLIIDRLVFLKDGQQYPAIEDCLDLASKSYMRVAISNTVRRVVLPNAYLIVFETRFDDHESEADIDYVRQQLAPLTLQVTFRDIYDNKTTIERDCQWFSRHVSQAGTT